MGHQSSVPAPFSNPEQAQRYRTGSWLGNASSNLASSFAATIGVNSNWNETKPSYTPRQRGSRKRTKTIRVDRVSNHAIRRRKRCHPAERSGYACFRPAGGIEAFRDQSTPDGIDRAFTHQTELTDQLFEDAIATTATMEKGNEELREARRRGKDSRLYILVFLIGASLSLLFLHYY
jgi:syntaxin 18